MTDRASGGFTLLELLVALVVLGFIMVGLTQGVRFGVRALDTQGRIMDERGDLHAVDRTLRQLIERIEPGRERQPARIKGTVDRLGFTSTLPAAAPSALRRADITVLASSNRLLLQWTPYLHVQRLGPPPRPAEVELLRGVKRVEFAYWTQAGTWAPVWSERVLPALIRIRIVFMDGDNRRWPDFVVAPLQERPGA